ncbi:ATP-binding protein [Streptomyces sp. N35]|uniref:ATP-binding protein n=1 Tax=Streptomyces sp. N35 TaxID=2795730 RepID=UPI0018F2E4F6|nr:ATP-binding protein [Streptomyces sp. N35]
MKQSAKTLGVAALGAAFAAAGAGTASAAPALPDPAQAVGAVTQDLPVGQVTKTLPGASEAVDAGQGALTNGLSTAKPTLEKSLPADTDPVAGLLGGLPVGGLPTGGLPTGGLPVDGLPVSTNGLPVQGLPAVGGLPGLPGLGG